ncbi:MAG: 50S ribosomal protein L21 [Bacteroidota bacterium]|nr:50S ribosomal protein L21 [Bacteroidota bacterium]MDP4230928.1 50S ribosomal protein L21 [Bacteroidota bacterium]MDP4237399.1 50S ribosomal protein L21 [Bacteroidota bacterium]
MFAIVEFRGEQYRIDHGAKQLRVAYFDGAEVGKSVSFDKILLAQGNDGKTALGGSAKIEASVAGHDRDAKIIVFKKKRRKRYRVTKGHVQNFTILDIKSFSI